MKLHEKQKLKLYSNKYELTKNTSCFLSYIKGIDGDMPRHEEDNNYNRKM